MATRYRNLDDEPHTRSLRHVLRWKLGLGPEPQRQSPSRAEVPFVQNDGAALRGAPRPSLTWVGHATYLVQLGGRSVLTDPILSQRVAVVSRNVPPGLTYETLPTIDVVTVSHNHRDHMDAPTLKRLGPEVTYVVGKGLGAWFRREGLPKVVELDWWERADVHGLAITFVPAQHWSRRGLLDEDQTLWGGFVIADDQRKVYHSGDTAYFSGFAEIGARVGPLDAAMLPIGAYDPRWFMRPQHMNPEDAVRAFVDLGAARFFAMHWGTFKLTDEPLDEPPALLRALWSSRGLDASRLFVPAVGETVAL
jgi:L-ascorbate metabolism protein UlaG (beta-lactamase superfamily)